MVIKTTVKFAEAWSYGDLVELYCDIYQKSPIVQSPALIIGHGGGFHGGDKASPPIVDRANFHAENGYHSFAYNYRLTQEYHDKKAVVRASLVAADDARALVRYIRAAASSLLVDTERIGSHGLSAGAIIGNMVGTLSDIESFEEEFPLLMNQPDNVSNPGYESHINASFGEAGTVYDDFWADVSATMHCTAWFDAHGMLDTAVPFNQAKAWLEYVASFGHFTDKKYYADKKHLPLPVADMKSLSKEFFANHL